jgi:hypothetical protein
LLALVSVSVDVRTVGVAVAAGCRVGEGDGEGLGVGVGVDMGPKYRSIEDLIVHCSKGFAAVGLYSTTQCCRRRRGWRYSETSS